MIFFHSSRHSAWALLICRDCRSSSTVFCQVFLGRPRGRLPSTSHSLITARGSPSSLLSTCPNQRSLLLPTTSSTWPTPHLSATTALGTLSWRDTRYTCHVSQHPSVTGLDAVLHLLCHWPGLRAIKKHWPNTGFIDGGSLLQGNPSVTQQASNLLSLTPWCSCPHCNCSPYITFSVHHVSMSPR